MFALAHVGAFVACLPLLAILVPLKAAEIDPVGAAALLSRTVLAGAIAASLVNIAAGALSDRTRSRFGRRRPWIFGGALGTVAAYFAIWRASSAAELFAAIILFQVAFNLFLPALVALLPDEVPDRSKGRMASLLALGPPLGLGAGSLLAGAEALTETARYVALSGLFIVLITPLLMLWREALSAEPAGRNSATAATPASAVSKRNFMRVWTSRLFTQIGIATCQGFILLFVAHAMSQNGGFPDMPPESAVSALFMLSTSVSIIAALIVGAASDRLGGRKLFVAASGMLICAGMTVIALLPIWTAVLFGMAVYGVGVGLYSSAEVALAAELLPSRRDSARDLAVLNLGNTFPQAVAPGLALLFVRPESGGYSALFLAGAAAAAVGGAVALRISRR